MTRHGSWSGSHAGPRPSPNPCSWIHFLPSPPPTPPTPYPIQLPNWTPPSTLYQQLLMVAFKLSHLIACSLNSSTPHPFPAFSPPPSLSTLPCKFTFAATSKRGRGSVRARHCHQEVHKGPGYQGRHQPLFPLCFPPPLLITFSSKVRIELTANHMGHFEFRLCPNNNPAKAATQACLDRWADSTASSPSPSPPPQLPLPSPPPQVPARAGGWLRHVLLPRPR